MWPDNSHVPPQGVPEKFSIKITFLEEPPFIIISDPDPVTGRCSMDRGVSCSIPRLGLYQNNTTVYIPSEDPAVDDHGGGGGGGNDTQVKKCCSGLCVDLLRKFEDDLGFSYELVRAEDPKWGTFEVRSVIL